ncbi:MAG: DUF362 domain-containing protein [Candidatus Omnitrophica bacterium]|nr:DUF362 domain-containing protein [Candidatus Omnitrophota bacterium]
MLDASNVLGVIQKKDKVAVKMHFGEEGNTGFINPEYAGVITKEIAKKCASAFLSDTNTLYPGRRIKSDEHKKLALEHGFTKEVTGLDVIIPDDTKKENKAEIEINHRLIKTAKIVRLFVDAGAIIAINHFKGHILTSFGGALKNLGMGCATREGKLAQHCDVAPHVIKENCVACGACIKVCPSAAIQLINKKAVVDKAKCIGCANCIGACQTMAMFVFTESGIAVQEKIAEYSLAVLRDKENKSGFISFAVKINKECDCWNMENPRIAPDVGILASNDPVSIDKASLDVVNKACGKDIFKAAHPNQDGMVQLRHAQEIGLGSLDYELITL